MNLNEITVTGAKEHNLKNINVTIPKNKLVIISGLSGSGKSTLAFKTLYAEGQRRYIESLSSYARQFLGRVDKPKVDKIEGLVPAIAIDQKTTSKNPRSTVGTITEIYDYLRLLYARVGVQHCHICGKPVTDMKSEDIVKAVNNLPKGSKIIIYAPMIKEKKGTFSDLVESLRNRGLVRARIDGITVRIDEDVSLSKTKKHTISPVIDRVEIKSENSSRVAQSIESALKLSYGEVEVEVINYEDVGLENGFIHHSIHLACHHCKVSFEPIEPLSFSFNSKKGACNVCEGLGFVYSIEIEKLVHSELSIGEGALEPALSIGGDFYRLLIDKVIKENSIDKNIAFNKIPNIQQKLLFYGNFVKYQIMYNDRKFNPKWSGIAGFVRDVLKDSKDLSNFLLEKKCSKCNGDRLKLESLAVKVSDKTISEILNEPIENIYPFFNDELNFKHFSEQDKKISKPIIEEIKERLFFLYDVGLGYLTLNRNANTISGGESQRIRIASQIGSGLTGVMYVLDEPSIGLHEKDTIKLISTLKSLRDKGNTLIVVEHDKETILNSDYVVDIGPKAGELGGEVVFSGTTDEFLKSDTSTAKYVRGEKLVEYFKRREQKEFLKLKNITINNLNSVDVDIPLQNFVVVTGVSGSGKSSLILQTLLPIAKKALNNAKKSKVVDGVTIENLDKLDKVIYLDQSPIGRTPRSNPSTYIGLMNELRVLFAATKEASIRGYGIGRFSFNVSEGRCEKCKGEGEIKIEMHFLPDVTVVCDSCNGSRYNHQTLEIDYKGKNISEILNMTVREALVFFKSVPKVREKLETLDKVGLEYIRLGQNATTLSGGEAQRVKLAKELSRRDTGSTLYILDEPTTGLHFEDIDKLVKIFHNFVDNKNSVLVIEHNLDIIKNADYIIDMGPDGGSHGGKIVDAGSPEELVKNGSVSKSYTAKFLKEELKLHAK